MNLKNYSFVIIAASLAITGCGKKYVAEKGLAEAPEKAYVQIDGSLSNSGKTIVSINYFKDCAKKYEEKGSIEAKGKVTTKPVAIRSNIPTKFYFSKKKTSYNFWSQDIVKKQKDASILFVPKPGETYSIQANESEKGFFDLKVFAEKNGKKTELKNFISDPELACNAPNKKN